MDWCFQYNPPKNGWKWFLSWQNTRFEINARLNGFWFNAARLQNQSNIYTSRYIFNIDSIEVGRIGSNWSATKWGFYRIGLQPTTGPVPTDAARRLEIYDEDNAPQLRISQKWVPFARYTDLETTNAGTFLIQPSGVNVGINLNNSATLTRTLDVNGNGRFRTLPSAIDNTLTNLVVSNANGELFIRDVSTLPSGGGGTGNVNACTSLTTSDLNFVPKWSAIATKELCRSLIYDNSANIGISNVNPLQKLDVNGNINTTNLNQGLYMGNNRFLVSEGNGYGWNIYLGIDAGPASPNANTGYGNIVVGRGAGISLNKDELWNVFIGASAGAKTSEISGNDASRNIFIGAKAGMENTSGQQNVAVGHWAGSGAGLTTYNGNVIIGNIAGSFNNEIGGDNVLLGNNTHLDNLNGNLVENSTALGSHAIVHANFSTAVGSSSSIFSDDCIAMGRPEQDHTLMGYNSLPATGNYRLYVRALGGTDGIYVDGDVFATGTVTWSDRNLKTSINDIDEATSNAILQQLSPKTYFFDSIAHPNLHCPRTLQYGLIAQDIEQILPSLVKESTHPAVLDSLGQVLYPEETFKGINYTQLIPILIQSLKSQQRQIDSLVTQDSLILSKLNELSTLINACCSDNSSSKKSSSKVELSNTIILNQNAPNPFAEKTTIGYSIPENIQIAEIIFMDNHGTVLKKVILEARGEGSLEVYSENLSSGSYSYTLIADGKVIDTKRMICTK